MLRSLAMGRVVIGLLTLLHFSVATAIATEVDEPSATEAAAAESTPGDEDVASGNRAVPASSRRSALPAYSTKHVIGAVARVFEPQSRLQFLARVDTGAASCSIHCEQWQIEDEAATMEENVGKPILILIGNHNDQAEWIKSHIESCVTVKTSEREELRYKIPLTLRWRNFEKQVVVTLNNRRHMTYPLLLGRNFLTQDFVVDIDDSPEPSTGLAQAR